MIFSVIIFCSIVIICVIESLLKIYYVLTDLVSVVVWMFSYILNTSNLI